MKQRAISCRRCGAEFHLEERESAFFRRIAPTVGGMRFEVPPPTLCYECRQRRKLAYRNERCLYSRRCDLTGAAILSVYAPDSALTVYEHSAWHSDRWEAGDYGREFDFSRPFFEQFFELLNAVPQCALDVKSDNENCDYTHLVSGNKDCYFIFAASENRDSMYSTFLQRNKDVVDCYFIFDSERCYECIDCYSSFNSRYCQNIQNCSDSYLLYNCRGCANCFACVSLINKQYHLFNEPYSKAEYRRQVGEIHADPELAASARTRMLELRASTPQKAYSGISNESVTGDHISFSKNSYHCFDCTHLEDCDYCTWMHQSRDCRDCYGWGLGGELGYESHLIGNGFYRLLFCGSCWSSVSNLMYCWYCVRQCRNLFGCVGMKGKEYCILNRQYSKSDYEELVRKIIAHMHETGEWGEFFPEEHSPFGYNETAALDYYPMTQQEVESRGWRWKTDIPVPRGRATASFALLPAAPGDVDEALAKEVFACELCARNFRYTVRELRFYCSMAELPPRRCFSCRYTARWQKRNRRTLYQRKCSCCGTQVTSTISAEQPDVVHCEACYRKAIY